MWLILNFISRPPLGAEEAGEVGNRWIQPLEDWKVSELSVEGVEPIGTPAPASRLPTPAARGVSLSTIGEGDEDDGDNQSSGAAPSITTAAKDIGAYVILSRCEFFADMTPSRLTPKTQAEA